MKNQFVTYEIALKLKELGFNEDCFNYFLDGELMKFFVIHKNSNLRLKKDSDYNICCTAPLWQQVIDWLLKTHKLFIVIDLNDSTASYHFDYTIVNSKERDFCDEDFTDSAKRIYDWKSKFKTDTEAREQAVLKAIELIQKK